jgi:quinolinate synthase
VVFGGLDLGGHSRANIPARLRTAGMRSLLEELADVLSDRPELQPDQREQHEKQQQSELVGPTAAVLGAHDGRYVCRRCAIHGSGDVAAKAFGLAPCCYAREPMSAPEPLVPNRFPPAPGKPAPPDLASIDPTLDLPSEIERLKRQKNVVLLAHYYQEEEIQDLADFVGDSLDLSRRAEQSQASIIAFAGVRFMAETAKILNPGRKVVLPDFEAGCSLESSCPPEAFRAWRQSHPGAISLTYINCSAAVKALSDIIVTSSNAEKIVESIPRDREILFAPDRHLGAFLSKKTGRAMTLWPGTCIVHEQFSEREIIKLKAKNPEAKLAAHPECPEAILKYADHVGSTRSILGYVTTAPAKTFLIATEEGIIHQMKKLAPDREYIPVPPDNGCRCNECPFMKLNTLEKLYLCIRDERPEIVLPKDLREAARRPLLRMLELS